MTTTTTITLTAGTTDIPALTATPAQAALLLFDLAGYAPDAEDACIESAGLAEGGDLERGGTTLGGLADLIDDGHPWTLMPGEDGHPAYLQRTGPDDAAGTYVAVIAG